MILAQTFNGAGDTRTPTLLNFVCFWLIEIPLAWLLANWIGWTVAGVFSAVVIAEFFLSVLSFLAFRTGKWKLQEV